MAEAGSVAKIDHHLLDLRSIAQTASDSVSRRRSISMVAGVKASQQFQGSFITGVRRYDRFLFLSGFAAKQKHLLHQVFAPQRRFENQVNIISDTNPPGEE